LEEFKDFDGKLEKTKLDVSQNTIDALDISDLDENDKIDMQIQWLKDIVFDSSKINFTTLSAYDLVTVMLDLTLYDYKTIAKNSF
jgi:hypothetical protein